MKPIDFYFSSQHEDEEILQVYHRHWFDILKQYFPLFILLILMIGGMFLTPYMLDDFVMDGSIYLFYFIETTLLLLIWISGFLIWFDYYLDIWIVTDERVVNVEQRGLFSRHVSELTFLQIQDISTEVNGFIPTVLNYGNVHIQTAAEQSKFVFRAVPNPYKIKSILMTLKQLSRKRHAKSSKSSTNA
jgi:hypothetical protein